MVYVWPFPFLPDIASPMSCQVPNHAQHGLYYGDLVGLYRYQLAVCGGEWKLACEEEEIYT